jgi:hypothetical protein
MRVRYKLFRGTLTTWDTLFSQAEQLATEIGPKRLINVSHAVAADDGTVTVWYWTDEEA